MTVRLQISTATPDDDQALQAFLRSQSSEGAMSICLKREPSYFDALEVEGVRSDVISVWDDTKIVALATRSEKRCYLNGEQNPRYVGYLSNLRIAPRFRKTMVLARGYRFLKELHDSGKSPFYLTTIMNDNHAALQTIAQGRAGLPRYVPYGEYYCYVLRKGFGRRTKRSARKLEIRRASAGDAQRIVDFQKDRSKTRQFYPAYSVRDLLEGTGLLRDLAIDDIYLAFQGSSLVGTLAAWNQTPFRQWSVSGYSTSLKILRVFYNWYAGASGRPFLPLAEEAVSYRMLSLCAIRDDSPEVLSELLNRILQDAVEAPRQLLLIGFHEDDPLREAVSRRPHYLMKSRLFVVHWEDGASDFLKLKKMIPYVELGAL